MSPCDELSEDLVRRHKVEDFSWSVIEAFGDDVEVILAVSGKVGSLGEVLPDEAVGIFVAAALPGAIGIGEEDLNSGVVGQLGMSGHFSAAIIGEGFAEGLGHIVESGLESAAGGFGIEGVHASEQESGYRSLGYEVTETMDGIFSSCARSPPSTG